MLRSGDPGVGARVVWDELPERQVWAGQAEVGISVGDRRVGELGTCGEHRGEADVFGSACGRTRMGWPR